MNCRNVASEVRHGDCLEVVRDLAAESVDLFYVDPPFTDHFVDTNEMVSFDSETMLR